MTSGERFGYAVVVLVWVFFALWVGWMVRN